jgi:hypothetical protein
MRGLVVFMLLVLGACDSRPDQWDAFVYPNRNNLSIFDRISGFKTFELCQQAAIDRMRVIQEASGGDYECGYKCGMSPEFGGLNVCEETRK